MNAREETTQAARSVVSMEDGNKHKIDLIDEWLDETAAAATSAAGTKNQFTLRREC
jgi:hypothetical protein